MPTDRELDDLDGLDNLIDASLPGYSAAEPRPGIEQRILANALARQPRRKWSTLTWALAASAVACGIAVLWMAQPHPSAPRILQPRLAATPASSPPLETVQQIPPGQPSRPSRPRPRTPEAAQLPKQEVFPTPTPITSEEERMLSFTNLPVQPPTHAAENAEIPPLRIAELNIKPLNMPETVETTPDSNRPDSKQP